MKFMFKALIGATIAATSLTATAQTAPWPSKPIRLVVPLPPGGGGDIAARVVAAELTTRLKQTVFVENKPGAGSVIGTQFIAKAAPDGYNLIMITDFHAVNAALNAEKMLPQPLPYDSFKDFVPVSRLLNLQIMLIARPGLGAKNLREVIAKAKEAPQKVSAASPGASSPHYVSFRLMEQMSGAEFLSVPYQGSGPATLAFLGGQVDLLFAAVGAAQGIVKDGKGVAIGVSGPKRDARAPEVPTIAEAGFPGFSVQSWMGILAPAGTPAAIVKQLNAELQQVLRDPQVVEKLFAAGLTAAPSTPEEFASVIRKDTDNMQAIFRGKK